MFRSFVLAGAAFACFATAQAEPPACNDPSFASGLKAFVEGIDQIRAAGAGVKEVRGFSEISYDQAADVRICRAEADLGNAGILDLKVTFNPVVETPGNYLPKVEYQPRA